MKKKKQLRSKVNDKARELSNKSKQLLGRDVNRYLVSHANKHKYNANSDYGIVRGAKRSLRDLADKNEPKNPEMHRIINQRSKLKEAAEYILSVLDEMDYIEKSEKKIKKLDQVNNKVKNMTYDEKEKFVKKYMHPDLPKKFERAYNNPIKLDSLSDDEDK